MPSKEYCATAYGAYNPMARQTERKKRILEERRRNEEHYSPSGKPYLVLFAVSCVLVPSSV